LEEGILRIWQNESVVSADETNYDDELIKQCCKDFSNAAIIAGNVPGKNKPM